MGWDGAGCKWPKNTMGFPGFHISPGISVEELFGPLLSFTGLCLAPLMVGCESPQKIVSFWSKRCFGKNASAPIMPRFQNRSGLWLSAFCNFVCCHSANEKTLLGDFQVYWSFWFFLVFAEDLLSLNGPMFRATTECATSFKNSADLKDPRPTIWI